MKVGNKRNMGATLKRLIAYILREYKWQCLLVALCILVSTVANIGGTLFMRNLIDDYILPFVNQTRPDLSPLFKALLVMAAVYYVGVFCTWAYNYIMIYVSQGMLKKVRDDLFRHMEHLPIRYFDTKSHGDIMSIYTNDTDTLRQVISQSMPQMLSAVITIVGVFISMLVLSRPLTLITVVMVVCMVCASWRLPPLAAVSVGVCGVIPFQRIERNGSLDLFKAAADRQGKEFIETASYF